MGLIWEYLRNPATFRRRQVIGCLGGCVGTPIILGVILLIIWAINARVIGRGALALLAFGAIAGFLMILMIVLGFWFAMRKR